MVPPGKQMFDLNGHDISVAEHFTRNLGAPKLVQPYLPCVSISVAPPKDTAPRDGGKATGKAGKEKVKPDDSSKEEKTVQPNWVPPEHLQILPFQPFTKLLSSRHAEKMIEVALRHPAQNQNLIVTEGFTHLGISKDQSTFKELGLTVGHQLLQIPARHLTAPKLVYRGQKPTAMAKNGSWNLFERTFYRPSILNLDKSICTVDVRRDKPRFSSLNEFGLNLTKELRSYGINSASDPRQTHAYVDLTDMAKDWDDVAAHDTLKVKLEKIGNPWCLVILLSKKEQDLYGGVKRICDQWLGVHTICFVEDKLRDDKINVQVLGNLALKFNIKAGGRNHHISPAQGANTLSSFQHISQDTIVFGADVSHPAAGMAHTPSVAAVVASSDEWFSHFPGSMRLQAGTQEMIEDLEDMVFHRIVHFWNVRRSLPSRAIFYRDGVSEDQFSACRRDEIPKIYKGFNRARDYMVEKWRMQGLKSSPKPLELTFIVVGKRHHTRFFACDQKDTYEDKKKGLPFPGSNVNWNGNLQPGLIVDSVITRPPTGEPNDTYDFFLQSHAAVKGTARSAHYSVLQAGNLNVNIIQRLTFDFCHNFMRSTTSVSYVGPAYYADRLCDRGAQYLRGCADPGLEMTEEEKALDKSSRTKAFAKRVAEQMSDDVAWNPPQNQNPGREPNPWHPNFDNCMFWL